MGRLEDKVAIITGGGSGIGQAIATLFAAEHAKVVVADLNVEGTDETVATVKAAGGEALAVRADVANPAELDALVASAVNTFGGIDILCNNAGITDPVGLLDQDWDRWDLILAVNTKAVAMLSQKVVPEMIRRGGGVIVNTASVAGHLGGAAGLAYTASKHAVAGITRQLAVELGPLGIRVNAFSPGPTHTPITAPWTSDPEFEKAMAADKPLRRWAQASEQASAALFLATSESSYLTGQVIPVDGGWTARA